MSQRIFAASYERGIELIAAGCPLDYPDALARYSSARRTTFRAEQMAGYVESRVYALSPMQTAYVMGLRLRTDRPAGTIISEWSFEPPWQGHCVSWDYDLEDLIPKQDRGPYRTLLDSRLTRVLNDAALLRRGCPVEGLVCGCCYQPVPESGKGSVSAKLTLVDDVGNSVTVRIALAVVRTAAARSNTFQTPARR